MKVLICDDHRLLRASVANILMLMPEVDFVGEAADGSEALKMMQMTKFDTVLMDVNMPGMNGLEVLQLVKERYPKVKVLMLSMHPEEQYALRSINMGASGYATKNIAIDELMLAVRKVSSGGIYISKEMEKVLAKFLSKDNVQLKHETLTQREFNIMIELAQGKSNLQIGVELNISNKTVSTYKSRILAKIDCSTTTELTRYCTINNLI